MSDRIGEFLVRAIDWYFDCCWNHPFWTSGVVIGWWLTVMWLLWR